MSVTNRRDIGGKVWALLGVGAIAATICLSVPGVLVAQDTGSILGALPRETSLVVRVANADQLLEKCKKSPLWGMKDRPEIKQTLDEALAEMESGLAEAKQQLGFDPMDLVQCFRGEVVMALGGIEQVAGKLGEALSTGAAPEMSAEDVPFAIAGEAGASAPQAREYLGKFFEFAVKEGAIKETLSVKGGTVTVLSDAAESPTAVEGTESAEPPLRLYFGEAGTRFFFGTSRSFLEKVMTGNDAEESSLLVKDPIFLESRKAAGDGDVLVYADIKQLTRSINSALSATFFAFYWQKAEKLIFGSGLNNFVMSYALEDRGIRNGFFVHTGGASDGMLGLLKGQPFPSKPPAFIPKSAKAYASMNLNLVQLASMIKEIAQLAMAFQGPGAGDVEAQFEQFAGVKFADFFGSFGDKLHYYGETFDAQNALASLNYILELKDESPLTKIFDRFSSPEAGMLQKETVKDTTIFSVPAGGLGEIAMAVTGKKLLIGGGKERVSGMIDRLSSGGEGLGGDPDATKLISSMAPAQVSMLSYSSKDYFAVYMDSIADTVTTFADEPEAKSVVAVLKIVGETLGASAGYAQWTDSGLRGENILLYR